MAVLVMPVKPQVSAYSFTIELERKIYTMRFHWNGRMGRWIMDIATREDVDILTGLPMLTGVDLIGRFEDDNLPPGDFQVYDTTGKLNSPDFTTFGATVLLLYYESGTLE